MNDQVLCYWPSPDDTLAWAYWYAGAEPVRGRKGWLHALVVRHLREPSPLPEPATVAG